MSVFWIIWSPRGTFPPRVMHQTLGDAVLESQRLAKLHPGDAFFVMKAVGQSLVEVPAIYKPIEEDGDVPF